MFPTISYPIVANRFAQHTDYLDVGTYDFSGATITMTVRDTWNTGAVRSTPVVTCTIIDIDGNDYSHIEWVIPKVTMAAMPLDPTDPSKDVVLVYDIHIDPAGSELAFVAFRGTFTVRAGATE